MRDFGIVALGQPSWRCPKTAMNEDYCVMTREYEIWRSRKAAPMEAKPVSQGVNQPSNDHFRIGVRSTDTFHDFATNRVDYCLRDGRCTRCRTEELFWVSMPFYWIALSNILNSSQPIGNAYHSKNSPPTNCFTALGVLYPALIRISTISFPLKIKIGCLSARSSWYACRATADVVTMTPNCR